MSKKYYRYFGGLLSLQENWLNNMSKNGYRLVSVKKLTYEFVKCDTDQYQYCVEFIAQKSKESADEYYCFLKELGYNVFYKNINLNYSFGKIRYRPWAEKGGKLTSNKTTFNRELLIIEKINDGKPFKLHTTFEDKIEYYKTLRNPWICLAVLFTIFAAINLSVIFMILSIISFIPVISYQFKIIKFNNESKTKEW